MIIAGIQKWKQLTNKSCSNDWTNTWMNEQVNKFVKARMNDWMNTWMNEQMNKFVKAWMNEWMNKKIEMKRKTVAIKNQSNGWAHWFHEWVNE